GADTFAFAETGDGNVDTITDYLSDDVLDLSALLDTAFDFGDPVASFVRAIDAGNGTDALVQVNVDGTGGDWENVAVLQGYHTVGNDVLVKLEAAAAIQTIEVA